MKFCKACGLTKSLSSFRRDHKGVNGISSRCRDCIYAVDRRNRKQIGRDAICVVACNRIVAKRQARGTETCWAEDYPAHRAVAHMLDDIGRVLPEFSNREFRSRFEDVRDGRHVARAERAEAAAQRKAERDAYLAQRRATAKARSAALVAAQCAAREERRARVDLGLLTEDDINEMLWERLRSHMKKQRRQKAGCIGVLKRRGVGIDAGMRTVLGYGIDDLRANIEAQFEPWMSWEKMFNGEIHIDHILPASAFNLNVMKEFKACYALHNLQPLGARENIQKSNKIWFMEP